MSINVNIYRLQTFSQLLLLTCHCLMQLESSAIYLKHITISLDGLAHFTDLHSRDHTPLISHREYFLKISIPLQSWIPCYCTIPKLLLRRWPAEAGNKIWLTSQYYWIMITMFFLIISEFLRFRPRITSTTRNLNGPSEESQFQTRLNNCLTKL